jgi:hypothetical protein
MCEKSKPHHGEQKSFHFGEIYKPMISNEKPILHFDRYRFRTENGQNTNQNRAAA